MKFYTLRLRATALITGIGVLMPQVALAAPRSQIIAGHSLAVKRCSGCHAVERRGKSPLAAAPPFRTLGKRYPLDSLQEALAEGIFVGHAGMPSDPWEPADIERLIAYLKTINHK